MVYYPGALIDGISLGGELHVVICERIDEVKQRYADKKTLDEEDI